MTRAVLHCDLDAFYASVEQRDHPEYHGRPVIVGGGPNEREVVSAASYEARRFGIHSAMPLRTAGQLFPDGIFVPGDRARYEKASDAVMGLFEPARAARLNAALDAVRRRFGDDALDRASARDTGQRRRFSEGRASVRKMSAIRWTACGRGAWTDLCRRSWTNVLHGGRAVCA